MSAAVSSTVMAGLDPAIQQHTDSVNFSMDGRVKPGHDRRVCCKRVKFFTRSAAGGGLLALALLAPAPANAWSLWNEMIEQISIKPQEKPMPFPQRSVPVPGTATMRVQDQESAANFTNPVKPTAESINTGRQLYGIYCTPCHGLSGTGNGLVGEKLSVRPFDLTSDAVQSLSDGFIFGYLTFRGTVMPSYANDLSPTERWHVINYLHHGLQQPAPQQAGNQANDQVR